MRGRELQRSGVRWVERSRVIHGKEADFVGRRYKEESAGAGMYGVQEIWEHAHYIRDEDRMLRYKPSWRDNALRILLQIQGRGRGGQRVQGGHDYREQEIKEDGKKARALVVERKKEKDVSHEPKSNLSRRKVTVEPSKKQTELLNRRILARSFQPVKFGSVDQVFKDLEGEFGKIECRDMV
ncbi:hypothetical protein PIB30_080534 [Stylosanthes scabra]|uniref:Uncharacterized protein n=1 Tax=Stylosanthes scabra TaxID=79078 RepID=A0ABU6RRA4_9FABA|nr:hypothetical protein [Stylosanthes scabra]